MATLEEMLRRILEYRDARDWKQFHKPKDMAISLSLEAAEVLEIFQWQSDNDIDENMSKLREHLGQELSDVLYWVLLMANDCGIDLPAAFENKMGLNERKYPISTSRGNNRKYDVPT